VPVGFVPAAQAELDLTGVGLEAVVPSWGTKSAASLGALEGGGERFLEPASTLKDVGQGDAGHTKPLGVGLFLGDAAGLAQAGKPLVGITQTSKCNAQAGQSPPLCLPGPGLTGGDQRLLRHLSTLCVSGQ
jgi:hypothetical protein